MIVFFSDFTVGHQLNRKDEASDEVASSAKNRHIRRDGEHVPNSSERRTSLKRRSRENRIFYESDDSSSSIPSPMTFHNYAKRRKFSESDDDSENYIRYFFIDNTVCKIVYLS